MAEYLCGNPPDDLGLIDLKPVEMMFWLYCPIKDKGTALCELPENLQGFSSIVDAARQDCSSLEWRTKYVYLTAKTLWITHENPGNRRGWHSDGFMTDDLNYIWSDRDGTLFWLPGHLRTFTQDHDASLDEMEAAAEAGPTATYADKHLLRLDQSVIHRVADIPAPGVRTFVKVSVSRHRYDLAGNSINHRLDLHWKMAPRGIARNHPVSGYAPHSRAENE